MIKLGQFIPVENGIAEGEQLVYESGRYFLTKEIKEVDFKVTKSMVMSAMEMGNDSALEVLLKNNQFLILKVALELGYFTWIDRIISLIDDLDEDMSKVWYLILEQKNVWVAKRLVRTNWFQKNVNDYLFDAFYFNDESLIWDILRLKNVDIYQTNDVEETMFDYAVEHGMTDLQEWLTALGID